MQDLRGTILILAFGKTDWPCPMDLEHAPREVEAGVSGAQEEMAAPALQQDNMHKCIHLSHTAQEVMVHHPDGE